MNRTQRIGLAAMVIAIFFAVVRFGTDNSRIEFFYGVLAYAFLIWGLWGLVNGKDEDKQ